MPNRDIWRRIGLSFNRSACGVRGIPYFYIVGHRGAAGLAPENTIPSFSIALKFGVDFVEFDVRSTKDGIPVVIHGASVNRTTDGIGMVCEYTLARIKGLDAGSWFSKEFAGVRIPTLDEALNFIRERNGLAIVEIKDARIERSVLESIENSRMPERTIVASFSLEILRRVRRLNDTIALMAISSRFNPDMPVDLVRLGIRIYALRKDTITDEVVRRCIARGIITNAWVVNDVEEAKRFLRMGVNMISTDFPDVLCRLREEMVLRYA